MTHKLSHIGLFAGIGGFELAARWAGWETLAWCEWNEFGQKVLRYHFPEAEGFGDITKTDFTKYANRIDVLTGGFPCQPYSAAGKRLGTADARHLWPEMLRAIREIRPRYVVGENVRGLTNWNGGLVFDQVQADLEAEGYKVTPFLLPACAVNAPHRRDRIWFVAYAASNGYERRISNSQRNNSEEPGSEGIRERLFNKVSSISNDGITPNTRLLGQEIGQKQTAGIKQCDKGNATNTDNKRLQQQSGNSITNNQGQLSRAFRKTGFESFPTQSPICSRNDGVSGGLDGITFSSWRNESIKAYGNAIVPQVAYEIFKVINQMESN